MVQAARHTNSVPGEDLHKTLVSDYAKAVSWPFLLAFGALYACYFMLVVLNTGLNAFFAWIGCLYHDLWAWYYMTFVHEK
jgi:hypothetical protein